MNVPETIDIEKYAQALNELIGIDSAYMAGDKNVDAIVEIIVAAKKLERRVNELTEENERLRVVADMSDTTLTDALRIVNEFCDSRIKRAKTDTVRKIKTQVHNKAIYPSTKGDVAYISLKAFDALADGLISDKN